MKLNFYLALVHTFWFAICFAKFFIQFQLACAIFYVSITVYAFPNAFAFLHIGVSAFHAVNSIHQHVLFFRLLLQAHYYCLFMLATSSHFRLEIMSER